MKKILIIIFSLILLCYFNYSNAASITMNLKSSNTPLIACTRGLVTGQECDVFFPVEITSITDFNNLAALLTNSTNLDHITIHIVGVGGNVLDGLAVITYIKNTHANVTMDIAGITESMYAIIAASSDKVILHPGSLLMFHGDGIINSKGKLVAAPTDPVTLEYRKTLRSLHLFTENQLTFIYGGPDHEIWFNETAIINLFKLRGTKVILGK